MAGPHHSGTYPARAAAVRADANANPAHQCWRCSLTLTESAAANARWYRGTVRWQAGHVTDGDPTSPLRAECSPCNERHGGRHGQARRAAAAEPHSEPFPI